MSRIYALMGVSVIAFALLLLAMSGGGSKQSGDGLLFYCAASNRAVMDEILKQYEQETGRRVEIQYGPSQTLLSSLRVAEKGDLFLPADDSYLNLAADDGLVHEVIPIASMRAVIVVPRGNPKGIKQIGDLLDDDVRYVLADPKSAAVGKVVQRELEKTGQWKRLAENVTSFRATVTEVANDVLVGAVDAGIVYDAVLHTYPDLQAVEDPSLADTESIIAVGVLGSSKHPEDALHFARYVAAADRGLEHYQGHGFTITNGDLWAERPELTIYAGSMLRPAIEETIKNFQQREGVDVLTKYNGCGILVAEMRTGPTPDAYFACDVEFMNQVNDLFLEPVSVSQNELVILVPKGNPEKITGLRDLARNDLRVGIGHEKQCAMGWLTQNTLKESGVQSEIMGRDPVQMNTGDLLVNAMRTGALDAVVVYLSNAAGAGELFQAIRIKEIECSIAVQPWAVARESKYPLLASRLFSQICSAESQATFKKKGFRWDFTQDQAVAAGGGSADE